MAKKMAIIATKGALDMAYPPLILASTAATLGWDVKGAGILPRWKWQWWEQTLRTLR